MCPRRKQLRVVLAQPAEREVVVRVVVNRDGRPYQLVPISSTATGAAQTNRKVPPPLIGDQIGRLKRHGLLPGLKTGSVLPESSHVRPLPEGPLPYVSLLHDVLQRYAGKDVVEPFPGVTHLPLMRSVMCSAGDRWLVRTAFQSVSKSNHPSTVDRRPHVVSVPLTSGSEPLVSWYAVDVMTRRLGS